MQKTARYVLRQRRLIEDRQRYGGGLGTERLELRLACAPLLSLTGPSTVLFEGERAEITLRLSEASPQAQTVFLRTQPGTATYGVDYFAPATTQIVFAPRQRTATFVVPTLRDSGSPIAEGIETFFVTATPANASLRSSTVTVRIADYAPPPAISISDGLIAEGDAGVASMNFTVTLSAPYLKPVTVEYASRDGSATVADGDYTSVRGALTFAPGEISHVVAVPVTGDRKLEANETVFVTLAKPSNATVLRSAGEGIIRNDEVDASGFQIVLNYVDPNLNSAWKAQVGRAAATWSRVITGDVPSVTYQGRFIDDFEISVRVEPLAANLLGYARTLQSRPGVGGLPFLGEMVMNSTYADLPGFYDTVAHEIAHALGFNPTMWTDKGLIGGTVGNPLFLGRNALREFNAAFGRTDAGVPLYNVGQPGDGSYAAHWRDAAFGNELMVSAGDPAATNVPLSRITIGHFADIGYTVNYAAANPYTPPAGARTALAASAQNQAVLRVAVFKSLKNPWVNTIRNGVAARR